VGAAQGLWEETDDDEGEHADDVRALAGARLWGVFTTGETCRWLPVREDAAHWVVVVTGHGWQQLNISATGFLRRWAGGLLDLPVLAHGAVPREWQVTPAGEPAAVPGVPQVARDPQAQFKTIVGPGHATPVSFDWAAIEADVGRPLPPDYKLLHETYGCLTDGVTSDREALVWNGIKFPPPLRMKNAHEYYAGTRRVHACYGILSSGLPRRRRTAAVLRDGEPALAGLGHQGPRSGPVASD
jgi:hypothetical protein